MSKSKEISKEEKLAKNIKFVQLSIGSIKRLPVTQSRSPEAEKFLFYFTVYLTGSSSGFDTPKSYFIG